MPRFTIHPNSPTAPSRFTLGRFNSNRFLIPENTNNIGFPEGFDVPRDLNELDSSGKNSLHHAIDRSDIKELIELVKLGVDLNAKDRDGNTPVHILIGKYLEADNNQAELMKNQETAREARDGRQFFIFENALVENKKYTNDLRMMFKILHMKGVDLNILNAKGDSLLHRCVHAANNDVLRFVLGAGPSLRTVDAGGLTPLMLSILLYCKPTHVNPNTSLNYLMDTDLDLTYQTQNGKEYLEQINKYFLSAGDDLFSWEEPLEMMNNHARLYSHLLNVEKKSPLIVSIEQDKVPLVQYLLRNDALGFELALFGRKPLCFKKMTKNEEIIKLISQYTK